jgi:hypothetical protein
VLPPSSDELIEEAMERGAIDEKTAAYYQLLAQFAPYRLPAEYRAQEAFHSLPSFAWQLVAEAHLSEYAPTEAADIRAMLASPDDPNWLLFSDDAMREFIPGKLGCYAAYGSDKDNGGGRVLGDVIETKYFRIKALLPTRASIPDQERILDRVTAGLKTKVPGIKGQESLAFADYLDKVFEFYVNTLGMKSPLSLEKPRITPSKDGTHNLVPIYVMTCDGLDNRASAAPRGFILTSVQIAFEHPQLMRVVLPHEIFHLVQHAYQVPTRSADWDWPYDATAVAAEDLYAPDVKRWSGRYMDSGVMPKSALAPMDRSFRCPEEPLHSSSTGPCKNRGNTLAPQRYSGDYSKFVLIKYLLKNSELNLDRMWTRYWLNDGDPRELVDTSELDEFHNALLADQSGELPFFEAEDRAEFVDQERLDFATERKPRYTFRPSPSLMAKSVGFRVSPFDTVSYAASGLTSLDATNLPIAPRAAHRWLIEIPEAARAMPDQERSVLEVVMQTTDDAKVSVHALALVGNDATPSRLFQAGEDAVAGMHHHATTTFNRWYSHAPSDGPLPKYLIVVLVNHADTPLHYRAGFTFTYACHKACVDYFTSYLKSKQCPAEWCAMHEDVETHQTCIDRYTQNMAAQVQGSTPDAFLCEWTCQNLTFLDRPYDVVNETFSDGSRQPLFIDELCSASGIDTCTTEPAGFVPLRSWGDMTCEDVE